MALDAFAVATTSLALAEVTIIALVRKNIITKDELQNILLRGSFALEEETRKAPGFGQQGRLSKDVQDLLMAFLQKVDELDKPDLPDE